LNRDDELRPPKPPRLMGGDKGEVNLGEGDSPWNSGMEAMLGGDYRAEGEPMDPEKRAAMQEKSKERLERMIDMSKEERIEEMRKERDARIAERLGDGNYEKKINKKASTGLESLSPEERHLKLAEHQKNMEDHRQAMDTWRAQHEDYTAERRAIMDAYRDLSQQIRESVFNNRPL